MELADWIAPPPRAAYIAMMACRLVAIDNIPGVHPVNTQRGLSKLTPRNMGNQAKVVCGNL